MLGRSIHLLRCCNVEDLHQAPSATRVWSEACWAGPTCTLAVVQDLETHCTGMSRVSMRLVADQSGVPCWTQVM